MCVKGGGGQEYKIHKKQLEKGYQLKEYIHEDIFILFRRGGFQH